MPPITGFISTIVENQPQYKRRGIFKEMTVTAILFSKNKFDTKSIPRQPLCNKEHIL